MAPRVSDTNSNSNSNGTPTLADQLTISQPGGADYAYHITNGTTGFSEIGKMR